MTIHRRRNLWLRCLAPLLAGVASFSQTPTLSVQPRPQIESTPSAVAQVNPHALAAMVESFTLGGFTVSRIELRADATPDHFSGSALFQMPMPIGPRKLPFKDLVLKGNVATGQVVAELAGETFPVYQGWTYQVKQAVISDQGSHLVGTATLAGVQLDLGALAFKPQGLQGTLTPGQLLLAEGNFTAALYDAEVLFGTGAPRFKGNLLVEIQPPVCHAATGETILLESGPITFDSALVADTGKVVETLATNLPLLHKGNTWRMDKVTFRFEKGIPVLSGPTRLQFPLQVFCRVNATGQPYITEAVEADIKASVPTPASASQWRESLPKKTLVIGESRKGLHLNGPSRALAKESWSGFEGAFPLPAAELNPAGLISYRLSVTEGHAQVHKGLVTHIGTRISGSIQWGPEFKNKVNFKNAIAALEDGLYLVQGTLQYSIPLGAYSITHAGDSVICDFSTSRSFTGQDPAWVGIFFADYYLALPIDLYTWRTNPVPGREGVLVPAKGGRFEADGGFSGEIAASLSDLLMLHVVPVRLDPFDLAFVDGAMMKSPKGTGHVELSVEGILQNFNAPFSFDFTQDGIEKIEIQTQTENGSMCLDTGLLGVDIVLESARLNPTNLDLTGRFDFSVTGADLPSIQFDHLVLEGSGGGIDGDTHPPKLGVVGSRWDGLPDLVNVNLWGYPFGLAESGFGTSNEGGFFVGFGGQMDVNPLLPSIYNRLLFTTVTVDQKRVATVKLENGFHVDQNLGGLGDVKADFGLEVKTANEQVSDAYFVGKGQLGLKMGDAPIDLSAGLRFGRSYQNQGYFPYFYALGSFTPPTGIAIAPDLEIYSLLGGLAQNFKPVEISDMETIDGTADSSLGLAVVAGVKVGTMDQFAFHGDLDLYVAQNLTTLLQGRGWLLSGRESTPENRQVIADVSFTRNPNIFNTTVNANIEPFGGFRFLGTVQLYFSPDQRFLHVGTREAPIDVHLNTGWGGQGFFTADFAGGKAAFGAGASFGLDKSGTFGPIWGHAWLNARGELYIEIDEANNPWLKGWVGAEGGAEFGMKFKTFWKTYRVTIFSGSIGLDLAFQAPGSPTFSGNATIHYDVLGLFSGSVNAHLEY